MSAMLLALSHLVSELLTLVAQVKGLEDKCIQ